jgi:O-methyltransferase involved in polyketide biosynthesis
MIYRPTHFKLKELVPEDLYNTLSEQALWNLFSEESLRMLDWIKDKFPKGSIIINDWSWGGVFSYSGLRTKASKHYSEYSAHSTGDAWDLKFSDYAIKDVMDELRAVTYSPHIRRVENGTTTWLHIDCKTKVGFEKAIYFFNP